MPKGQPAESIVVPHPEPYVRKQGFGSQRLADLRAGKAVFLAGFRRPGWYRDKLAKEGLQVSQREAEMLSPSTGEMVKGITIWVTGRKPEAPPMEPPPPPDPYEEFLRERDAADPMRS